MELILALTIGFFVSLILLPMIIEVCHAKSLVDLPDNRKCHASPTPSLGGIAVFSGLLLGTTLVQAILPSAISPSSASLHNSLIAACFLVFLMGCKDDLMGLGHRVKFFGQIAAALIVIFNDNLLITNLHGFLGLHQIPVALGAMLTLGVTVLVINAFNLIDGIDGLCGSLSVVALAVFAGLFLASGELTYSIVAASLLGAVVAFLIYNWNPAQLFLGDSGSLLLGLCMAVFGLKLYSLSGTQLIPGLHSSSYLILTSAILFVPVFDTVRVFTVRLISGLPLFIGDRNHIHHIATDAGLGAPATTSALVMFNISLIAIALMATRVEQHLALGLLMLSGLVVVGAFKLKGEKRTQEVDISTIKIEIGNA